ncbi:uncharacterized protein BX663DRAFT_523298 [Cokeromyces recurvatus]|uniref:uncharacterized protein n=1 Tax=Cokeromyces recurvatus TaxID=90255 RepID=UPI002220D6B5|nr:uncharacterized protein BX663DRAFT_523298 [Cokeromyces recurvatus]KAI7898936.1 hypothetical protein BX663DRAFT_523298 [Cokeromyces recurvatus]
MSNSSDETVRTHRFSFQHFDQESDVGIENANGERIRKRKRPGRKPNPPTLQERRAQNRAAQRAFREREQQRQKERERQWASYVEEIKQLKAELAVSQYEAKYLRACVLHMTLKFLTLKGSVPHIWTESRIIPSNDHGEYKQKMYGIYKQPNEVLQTPALLDMILENQHIVDFDKALHITSQQKEVPDINDLGFEADRYEGFITNEIITLNQGSQEPIKNFPRKRKQRQEPTTMTTEMNVDIPFKQKSTNQHKESTASSSSSSPPPPISDDQQSSSQILTLHQKPVVGVINEPPTLKTAEDLIHMPAIQALHLLRLQLKLGSILGEFTAAALLPTALQRVVPHDIRIDYIPGPSIRDKMIIFQDYYDINECFQYLTRQSCFIGGDIRDSRNWVIDPEYSIKFWFLSHQLVEDGFDECLKKKEANILTETYITKPSTEQDVMRIIMNQQ